MTTKPLIIVFALAVLGTGCAKKPKRRILIDQGWNVEYAKNACESLNRSGEGCPSSDPKADVLAFQEEIKTAFFSDSVCHGASLTLVPNDADWMLMIDYVPGQEKQNGTSKHQAS